MPSFGKEMRSLAKGVWKSGETAKISWYPPWPRRQSGRYLREMGLQVSWVGARLRLPKPLRPEIGRSQEFPECHFNPSVLGIWTFEPSHWQDLGAKD